MRQTLFSHDLAYYLLWALLHYNDTSEPLFVVGEEISIKELAESIASAVGFESGICWLGGPDGALRRTANVARLQRLYCDPLPC